MFHGRLLALSHTCPRRRRPTQKPRCTISHNQPLVAADVAQARAYGATGVPFFVVDQRYGVSGAQPTEVFEQVLTQAWAEAHPVLTSVGGDADACGPDGCAI